VDDEVVGAAIRGQILEAEGYAVVLKYCPFEALSCDLSTFDLAVIDFEMSGMNGRELFLRMRAQGARFPILLLSSASSFLSREDRVLFSRCINKGESVRALLDAIPTFLAPNELPDFSG
jgi:CheY-like chemotaxis protein